MKRGYFLDTMRLPNFFDFSVRDNEGVLKVYQWLRNGHSFLVLCDDKGVLIFNNACIAHTDEASINHEVTGNEKYVAMDFSELKQVFLAHPNLLRLSLNPNSDAVTFNRVAFTEND
ncbi:hypothetical protein ACFO26_09410 [Lactococcus nasutitermitis]|uniref:Uncharacterized protein n=1 Tax=Lactococcus nasutitermitis TaxID=1652957 RepID=A0ABV9JI11_9LACT|nr:hypothetical protein [Lactococcus nasutitermitis]